ncbi:AAA-ATPase-like domain-containing protein [Favolaschia claudopus]|uniref:AAA-ATPase-like domain-containing protein n=1 Tax=Favolaschia claudopus TaxID=2862362 RepID=A0AAW0A3M7_9AGAR
MAIRSDPHPPEFIPLFPCPCEDSVEDLKPQTALEDTVLVEFQRDPSIELMGSPCAGTNPRKRGRTDDEPLSSEFRSERVKRRSPSTVSAYTTSESYSSLFSKLRYILPGDGDVFIDFCHRSVVFIDKTPCILELPDKFRYIILRPPKFGKTTFLSTLFEYYDVEAADEFQECFQSLAVFSQAIAHRSRHLCLSFRLPIVETMGKLGDVEEDLDFTATNILTCFLLKYAKELKISDPDSFLGQSADKFGLVFDLVQASGYTLFVEVDDYDAPIINRTFDHLESGSRGPDVDEIKSLLDRIFWRPLLAGCHVIDKLFIMGIFPVTYEALKDVSFSDPREVPSFPTFCGFTEDEAFDLARSVLKEPDLHEMRRRCGKFSFPFHDGVAEPVLHPRQVIDQILETQHHCVKPPSLVSRMFAILPLHSDNAQEASLDGLIELVGAGVVYCDLEFSSSSMFDSGGVTWRDLYYAGALTYDRQSKVLRLNNSAILELIHSSVDSIVLERHGLHKFSNTWYICNLHETLQPVVEAVSTILQDLVQSSFGRKHEPNLPGALELLIGNYKSSFHKGVPKILFPPSDGRVQVPAYPRRTPYPRAPEFPTHTHIWELKTLTLRGMWLGANPNDDSPTLQALEELYEDLLGLAEEELLRRPYTARSPADGAMETVEVGSFLDDDPVVPQFLSVGGRILLRVPFVEPELEPEWEEEKDGYGFDPYLLNHIAEDSESDEDL